MAETATRHERDYLERTIETVRNHRNADNCWPSWANIFADEIERLWDEVERYELARHEDAQRIERLLQEAEHQAGVVHDVRQILSGWSRSRDFDSAIRSIAKRVGYYIAGPTS